MIEIHHIKIQHDQTLQGEALVKSCLEKLWNIKLYRPKELGLQRINGIPDYAYKKDEKIYYVEIKCDNDGWRSVQAAWYVAHQEENYVLVYAEIEDALSKRMAEEKKKIYNMTDEEFDRYIKLGFSRYPHESTKIYYKNKPSVDK